LRPLTPRGKERTEQAARGLARALALTRIVTSPLVRATQSADVLREAAELKRENESLDALAPGGSYHEVVAQLKTLKASETVALVGHEPDLGKLAAVLLFAAPARSLPLKKAGACVIDFVSGLNPGEGKLVAFLPPRFLRRRSSARVKS
jgi:phosphohistidine phosphatase